jgi:hypothetical protein
MPLTREEFDLGNFKTISGNNLKVLNFLKENPDNAYTSKEVATELGIKMSSCAEMLRRLRILDLIDFKKPYYIAKKESVMGRKNAYARVIKPEPLVFEKTTERRGKKKKGEDLGVAEDLTIDGEKKYSIEDTPDETEEELII